MNTPFKLGTGAFGAAGGGGVKYIFRDLFNDIKTAAQINNSYPTVKGSLNIKRRNTVTSIAINIICTITQWITTWFGYSVITRTQGYILKMNISKTNEAATTGFFGFSSTVNPTASAPFSNLAFRLVRYGSTHEVNIWDSAKAIILWRYDKVKTNTFYDYYIALRSTGAYFLMSGNGFTPNLNISKLLYVIDAGNTASIYPSLGYGDSVLQSNEISLIDASSTKWGTDTIYTDKKAIVNINDTIIHTKDAIIEFTYTVVTNDVMELSIKYLDDNNRMFVEFTQAAGTIKLKTIVAGYVTELKSYNAAAISANGTVHRYLIFADINETRVYCNNIGVTGDEYFKFLSGVYIAKVNKAGTNLISYPIYLNRNSGDEYIYNSVDRSFAGNAENPLTTPTYDGSNQALHPDVIYIADGWNGYTYWMALTPLPSADNTKENPSILASDDGLTWVVPDGLTNPISAKPLDSYHADTELYMIGDILYCFYQRNYSAEHTTLMYKYSSDGITWSAEQTFCVDNDTKIGSAIGIIHDRTNYQIYGCDVTNKVIRRTVVSNLLTGDLTEDSVICSVPMPTGYTPWHLNASIKDGIIYLIWVPAEGYPGLFISISRNNGTTWETSTLPFIKSAPGKWDASIYRSALLYIDGDWHLWYSNVDSVGVNTRIGHTIAYFNF